MSRRVLLSCVFLAACSQEPSETVETELSSEVPYEGVCWHFTEQVPQTVYAAPSREEFLEVASLEHTAIRVILGDIEGGKGGYVRFEVPTEADYLFFTTEPVLLRAYDLNAGNAGFEPLEVYPGGCEELQGIWKGVLGAKSYDLLIGPTDAHEVTVVFAAGASEHNHK